MLRYFWHTSSDRWCERLNDAPRVRCNSVESQQNIGLLKNGKTKSIRFESILKICIALDCEIGDLFEIDKHNNEKEVII